MEEEQKNLEKTILDGIFRNDNRAWERFIDIYGRLIHHCVCKTALKKGIRRTDDLGDLYQDFLLSLIEKNFKKLRSFRFECSLKTWVSLLATRFTLIWAKKIIHHPPPQPLDTDFEKVQTIIESVRDQRTRPDEDFEEKEIMMMIDDFIKSLDPIDKDIFTLHFLEEKTPKEIIFLKGIPRATVYRKISGLKKELLDSYHSKSSLIV